MEHGRQGELLGVKHYYLDLEVEGRQ